MPGGHVDDVNEPEPVTEDQDRAERVERLALECFERLPSEGDVVDLVCATHPDLIEAVRGVMRELDGLDLIGERVPAAEPTEFGDFRLLRRLGFGGMGVVWLAEQKSLGRRVAVKVLRTGLDGDARARERFRREALALSRLDHPGICTVFEAGQVGETPYLAMRFIEGESLAARLDRLRAASPHNATAREIDEVVHLVEKVARALHAAHEAGVVHRDVKPGNILLDRAGEPVVVDFGLARADDAALTALTVGSQPVGTPAYMAPEQLTGASPIDRRTDVWALGALLYECATLHTPFSAPTRDSMFRRILHEPPGDPRRLTPAIGRDLAAVLGCALEKEPRRRFPTALEFADELGRIRRREPIRTRAPGPWLRAWRWSARNRAASAVLATVTLALVVAIWLLARAHVAEQGLRARALLDAANEVRQENPTLAFKLAREAFALGTDEPRVLAYVQEVLFDLRDHKVIRTENGKLEWVEFSPDGRYLVVTGVGQRPTVHRASDGEEIARLPLSHKTKLQIPALAFAPRADLLAAGTDAGFVELFTPANGFDPPILRFGDDKARGAVLHVAFSADGLKIVVAHAQNRASLWSRDGQWLRDLEPGPELAAQSTDWRAAFLPDGRVVAAGAVWSADGSTSRPLVTADGRFPLRVRRISVGASRFLTQSFDSDRLDFWTHDGAHAHSHARGLDLTHGLTFAEFAPDGERSVASYDDGSVHLFDAQGSVVIAYRAALAGAVMCARFSPDGRWLALAENSGLVVLWDGDRARLPLAGHRGTAFRTSIAPDGRHIASVGWDGTARVWSHAPLPGVPERSGYSYPDVAVVGSWTVWTPGNGTVHARDGHGVERSAAIGKGWSHLSVAPDRRSCVVGCDDGTVWRFDPSQPQAPECICRHTNAVWEAFLLADESLLLLEETARRVLWRDARGAWSQHGNGIRIEVDRSGSRVLIGGGLGGWRLLVLRDGELLEGPSERGESGRPVASLQFTADGQRALIGTFHGQATFWQLDPKQHLQTFDLHQHSVHALAFSPDERQFASASQDGSVAVHWLDGTRPKIVLTTRSRGAGFRAVFVDATHLVSATSDGAVRWWSLDAPGLATVLAEVPVGPLTTEERARFPGLLR